MEILKSDWRRTECRITTSQAFNDMLQLQISPRPKGQYIYAPLDTDVNTPAATSLQMYFWKTYSYCVIGVA